MCSGKVLLSSVLQYVIEKPTFVCLSIIQIFSGSLSNETPFCTLCMAQRFLGVHHNNKQSALHKKCLLFRRVCLSPKRETQLTSSWTQELIEAFNEPCTRKTHSVKAYDNLIISACPPIGHVKQLVLN